MAPHFTTVDPLAEMYYSISPYAYCAGNPVVFIDPNGEVIVDMNGNVVTISWDDDENLTYGFNEDYSEKERKEAEEHFMKNGAKLLNAMKKTESGMDAIKDMVGMETEISLFVTEKTILDRNTFEVLGAYTSGDDNNNGKIDNEELTEDGYYKKVSITVSTYGGRDLESSRFFEESAELQMNVKGVHEWWHLQPGQIKKDMLYRAKKISYTEKEYDNTMLEVKTWLEYRMKHPTLRKNIEQMYRNRFFSK